jgi:membrane protease YdiL (CAAX protease family)
MVVNKETSIAVIISVFMYTFVFITANYIFGDVSNKMNGLALGIGIGCGILWRLYYRKTH